MSFLLLLAIIFAPVWALLITPDPDRENVDLPVGKGKKQRKFPDWMMDEEDAWK